MKAKLEDVIKEKTVKDVVHYIVDNKMDGQMVNEENIEQYIQERLTSNIAYYKYNFTDYQFISAKKEIKKDVDNIMGMFELAEIDDNDSYNKAFKEWSNKAFGYTDKSDEQTEKSKKRKKHLLR